MTKSLYFESSNAIYHAINVTVHGKRETNSFPYVVRSSVHNGIKGYIVEPKNGLNSGNTISLAQDTGEFFYQEKSYFTGNKVKVLMPIGFELTKRCALYLMTAMQKAFYAFTWGSSFNTDVMKKVEVVVPVTDSGQLDVQYMEQYIKRVEANYTKRVEAYLATLGYESLDDCELSSQDPMSGANLGLVACLKSCHLGIWDLVISLMQFERSLLLNFRYRLLTLSIIIMALCIGDDPLIFSIIVIVLVSFITVLFLLA